MDVLDVIYGPDVIYESIPVRFLHKSDGRGRRNTRPLAHDPAKGERVAEKVMRQVEMLAHLSEKWMPVCR